MGQTDFYGRSRELAGRKLRRLRRPRLAHVGRSVTRVVSRRVPRPAPAAARRRSRGPHSTVYRGRAPGRLPARPPPQRWPVDYPPAGAILTDLGTNGSHLLRSCASIWVHTVTLL